MANSAVDKAMDGLDGAVEAVRQAVSDLPAVADAVSAAAHGASGGGIGQYFWWLSGHAAHACHVQEKREVRG